MAIPLSFLRDLPAHPSHTSLGEYLAEEITDSGRFTTLLDCIPTTAAPAIHSTDPSRSPLRHATIHAFVSSFVLPTSTAEPLGPNDRVMVVLPTGPANALALLAVASYHTCAPVNASATAAELKVDARRLGAKAVLTTRDAEDRLGLRALRDELGCEVIFVDERMGGEAGLFDMRVMGDSALNVSHMKERKPSRLHGPDDQSLVLHTSGTSGQKKVVPYTLRSLIVGTCAVVKSWDITSSDINMNMMPLFHVGGIVRNLFAPIMSGGSVIMCGGFDSTAFWTLAQELRATWYYAAPTMHHAILASRPEDIVPSTDLCIRMICNAAGGLLPNLATELRDTFGGAVILPSYGMTECMPIASPPTTYALDRPGCSGLACGPHLSIRHPLDPERELPRGETGAVSVRGLPTFEGYETAPGAPLDTSAFSSGGWFDSGDMGYMDADGYLYITGRSKEIINKGGEVISPFEIEEAIMVVAKDRVKNTLAFAVEHDVFQETIGVVIVSAPGTKRLGLPALHESLRDRLHPSKWPFVIVYMDDLPKNEAGKPLRINLGSRLGLGCLSDQTSVLHRHFEAETPGRDSQLSTPIACKRVDFKLEDIQHAIFSVTGVTDVAMLIRTDGTPEGFVSATEASTLDAAQVKLLLSRHLHDYHVPDHLHIFNKPLTRVSSREVDFTSMKHDIEQANASSMSKRALVVRELVAQLLLIDQDIIDGSSDFFLLGGNSLLVGRLAYAIRKETGADLDTSSLFMNSTISGIARLIDIEDADRTPVDSSSQVNVSGLKHTLSEETLSPLPDTDGPCRDQTHPLVLIVQAIPMLFFYPLKAALTWWIMLFVLSSLTEFTDSNFFERASSLLCAILGARLVARTVAPISAILFKWIVIGKYRPGRYRMWSVYYLRWWIVKQALRAAGRGIFALDPFLETIYYRLLGAKIGKDVQIMKGAKLGELDMLTFEDGCRVDANTLIRGFCVERDGYFRLENTTIGRNAVINTYTQIAPGSHIPDNAVYGPHASSYEKPSPGSYVDFNRTTFAQPHCLLRVLVAFPIIFVVVFVSYMPWIAAIWLMLKETILTTPSLNAMESVIFWFASPQRIFWHAVARIIRAVLTPLVHLALSIALKRAMGLTKEGPIADATEWDLLRRYINSVLLSKSYLHRAFDILGTHYEMTSVVWRAMGAKIGQRVYWPGSGLDCADPELVEIGDDVVFGSRSELFTTDRLGSKKIRIGAGAMVADRCVLLPGVRVGRRTVMGSGALGKRDGMYEDNSTWMGNAGGEAIRFAAGRKDLDESSDTTTPFGRAFYGGSANYFVLPYFFLVTINILVAAISSAYWSISAVTAAQFLRQLQIHMPKAHLFHYSWYRFGTAYGLIAVSFVIVLNIQAAIAISWVIVTKWAVMGRRREGPHHWDTSSYCQRWQLHLVLSRPLYRGQGNGGVLAPLTGTAYYVWYLRALGATIGRNCSIYPGGTAGLMTEPDLVHLGDNVSLDECSVVAHVNSRGKFALNHLNIGHGCAMRSGSRLLSGASMEDSSILLEHTLLPSGEIAEAGFAYSGWPARRRGSIWSEKHKRDL
ncbi:hypothetical protein PLICRDRAFT_116163 [Plicaturopsis crispa FD-325 SS-3]|nr:hypothetical protein PLICRDRAFT_116163 [Plicaturopsis crispa FD-325 SS-3]